MSNINKQLNHHAQLNAFQFTNNVCNALDSSRCMWYQITSRSSPPMQLPSSCKVHTCLTLDISPSPQQWMHEHMTRLNAYVHTKFSTPCIYNYAIITKSMHIQVCNYHQCHLIKYAHTNNCTYIQHTYIHHQWTSIKSTILSSSRSSSYTTNTFHNSDKEDKYTRTWYITLSSFNIHSQVYI